MIRFINLCNQISYDGETFEFAWYNTVTDRFIIFNGSSVWTDWQDFEEDFRIDPQDYKLGRFVTLFDYCFISLDEIMDNIIQETN